MEKFVFNGDWSYRLKFPAFTGFQSRGGAYTSRDSAGPSDGSLNVEFEDDMSDNSDPYPEQIKALEYVIANQHAIVEAILQGVAAELPEIIINYGLQDEENYKDLSPEKIKSLIGISTIYIKIPAKDEVSYIDFSGGSNWDEEHGLNILMHKERVLTVGGIDGNSGWDAIKDNGTYEAVKNKPQEKTVPRKYKPHPKYNKLKPSHKSANETFEISLISGNHNEIFKALVNSEEININGKWESQNKTFLESACWYNNNDLVAFLLEKGADIRYAIHQCVTYNSNVEGFELILKHGGDINQQNLSGDTVLTLAVAELASAYDSKAQHIKYKWGKDEELNERIQKHQEQIRKLIKRGADVVIRNRHGFDAYAMARNLPNELKNEMTMFIDSCIKPEKPRTWKFW